MSSRSSSKAQLETPKRNIHDFYLIGKEIGSGTYSTVKLATNLKTGEQRAVKVMKRSVFRRPELIEREISILKKVDHPNIVKMYDLFEDEKKIYLVLELIHGGDLFDQISKRNKFSEEEAADIVKQILEALSYLHKEGIVHRDIKVDNILCQEMPGGRIHIFIADFGLSRFYSNEIQMKSAVGSLEYTAPEVFHNKAGYGPGCDLWSVGVVAYILLTKHFPFSHPNPKVTYEKICNVEYDWNGQGSMEVKDFCHRLWKKEPNERYNAQQALTHPWVTGKALENRTPSFQRLFGQTAQ